MLGLYRIASGPEMRRGRFAGLSGLALANAKRAAPI